MKQHHTLQPKLRFPEFEEEWLEFKFKDLYRLKNHLTLRYVASAIPYEYTNKCWQLKSKFGGYYGKD